MARYAAPLQRAHLGKAVADLCVGMQPVCNWRLLQHNTNIIVLMTMIMIMKKMVMIIYLKGG